MDSPMTAPELDDGQRLTGAAKSLRVRQARAQVKRQLHTGNMSLNFALIDDPDMLWMVQGMKVKSLLQALPGIGPTKAEWILREAGLTADKTVRALGHLQRKALLDAVAARSTVRKRSVT